MYPILASFGSITVYSLWVCITLGFLVALVILNQLIKNNAEKLQFIAEYSIFLFLAGLITARTAFIVRNLDFFFQPAEEISPAMKIIQIWDKGLSFWGGLIGMVLILSLFCYLKKQKILEWLDILIISTMGGMVFGNIGTFLDGKNYGNDLHVIWGVMIESSSYAVPIHPIQLYAAIYTFILTVILFFLYKSKISKDPGKITLIGVASYSVMAFLEEFLRGDESYYFYGLRETQIYCIIAFLISIPLLYWRFQKSKKIET